MRKTIVTYILLAIWVAFSYASTVSAAVPAEYINYVKESTMPMGSVWEIGDVWYKPEDSTAAVIIDLENGKKGLKFKKAGDVKLTAIFQGKGKVTIWKELVHVIPESTMPKDMSNSAYVVECVLELVNQERAKVGAPPLRMSEDLQIAAYMRAMELVDNCTHTRPNGSSFSTVLKKQGKTCGENIAAGPTSPDMAVAEWMKSDGHRENMLDPAYREMGVGLYSDPQTPYKHYWIQLFRG